MGCIERTYNNVQKPEYGSGNRERKGLKDRHAIREIIGGR